MMMTFVSCGPINRLISFPWKTKPPFCLTYIYCIKNVFFNASACHDLQSLELRVLCVVGFRIRPMRPISDLMIEGLHHGMIYDMLRPTNGRTDGRTNGPADGRTDGRKDPPILMQDAGTLSYI